MNNKVLVVVDMQNDFVTEGGSLALTNTNTMIAEMYDYITQFKEDGGQIIYTMDTHDKDSCEFESFPAHCVSGTWGHNLHPAIEQAIEETNARMLWKHSFGGPMVSEYLAETHPDADFTVIGVCTHICVHDVVSGLVNTFKNQFNKVPKVTIPKDLVADFDLDMEAAALKRLSNLYGVQVA